MKSFCLLPVSFITLLLTNLAWAAPTPLETCLQQRVIEPASIDKSVAELRHACEQAMPQVNDQSALKARAEYSTGPRSFFTPYKKNYVIAGNLENDDGSRAFSGNSTDIKFEMGLKFRLLPNASADSPLAPLHFGYSQRSWWDILEASAPFREHNYNPEVFWEFDRSAASSIDFLQSTRWVDLFKPDRVGFEHQSNGLGGQGSRSWDRLYLERNYTISEMLSVNVKLWDIVNQGDFNEDISAFMGYGALTTRLDLNNWLELELLTFKGTGTSTISYQLDLILPISRLVNSKFFISYFDGYGEALINYNKRSKSLRAGFYFPLDLLRL
ncbi:MAG: phospholipase A [Pseudomonadales bacterium]|nr:phospholipase A [Pseudomonadales bacterium]